MKRLVSLLVLALVASSASAQLNYGIKGGAALVDMSLDYLGISNDEYRPAYQVGIYGVHQVSERVFFRSELFYANKGFRAETPSVVPGNPLETFSMHLHYLSLPLLVGYSPTERLFVLVGPEVSYLLAARSRFESGSSDVGGLWDEPLDIGLTAGVGYQVSDRMSIDVRYVYGFRDVAPTSFRWVDPQDPLIDTFEFQSRNRVFQLSLSYRLN